MLGDDPLKTMATLAQKAVSKVGQVVVDKITKNNAENNNNNNAASSGTPQNFNPSAFFGSNNRPAGAFPAGSSAQSSSSATTASEAQIKATLANVEQVGTCIYVCVFVCWCMHIYLTTTFPYPNLHDS